MPKQRNKKRKKQQKIRKTRLAKIRQEKTCMLNLNSRPRSASKDKMNDKGPLTVSRKSKIDQIAHVTVM